MEEVYSFLRNDNENVVNEALQIISSVGCALENEIIELVLSFLSKPFLYVNAINVLINMDYESISNDVIVAVFKVVIAMLQSNDENSRNSNLMLLGNMTTTEENCGTFISMTKASSETPILRNLMEFCLEYNPQAEPPLIDGDGSIIVDWNIVDSFQHMVTVLSNMSRTGHGRDILMLPSSNIIPRLLSQIRSQNVVRRRSAVGCIRNCLFDSDAHFHFVTETQGLTSLLFPLVVATPFEEKEKDNMDALLWMQADNPNKKHEREVDIIRMLLESLLLLCQRKPIRAILRKKKVYYVVRNLDLIQEDEEICELINDVVQMMIRDEEETVAEDQIDSGAIAVPPSVDVAEVD